MELIIGGRMQKNAFYCILFNLLLFSHVFALEKITIVGSLSGANHVIDNDGNIFRYSIFNLLDFDKNNVLAMTNKKSENAPYISSFGFHFKNPVVLDAVIIYNGFQIDDELYKKNDRIKEVEIVCFLGKVSEKNAIWRSKIILNDQKEAQKIKLPNLRISDIDFRILSSYPGTKYTDICISELEFWNNGVKYEVGNLEEAKRKYIAKRIKEAYPRYTGTVFGLTKPSTQLEEALKKMGYQPGYIEAIEISSYEIYRKNTGWINGFSSDFLEKHVKGKWQNSYPEGDVPKIGEWKVDQYGNLWIKMGKSPWKIAKQQYSDNKWFPGTDLEFEMDTVYQSNP